MLVDSNIKFSENQGMKKHRSIRTCDEDCVHRSNSGRLVCGSVMNRFTEIINKGIKQKVNFATLHNTLTLNMIYR